MSKRTRRTGGWPIGLPFKFSSFLLVVVLLAGCDAAHTPARSTPTHVPTPFPTIAVPQPAIAMQQAWGDVTVHPMPSALPDNRVFDFENAATPDGQWLIGTTVPRDFITNTTRLSYAVLYNIATRRMVTMRALLHPQSQILAASADDNWVVWSEADDQPDFFDWTMFAYNRQSGQTRQLVQAVRVNGKPVQGPSAMPVVSNGRVVWGQAIGSVSPDTLTNAVVRMEDLSTGKITTLATKAGNPCLARPWLAWGQITSGSHGDVVVKNLETGQSEQLLAEPSSISIAGTSMAYDDTTSVYFIPDITHAINNPQVLATALNDADHLQYVTLNDRLVAWAQDSTTQVWDRVLRRLVTLPVTNGESDSWVGGRTLVWLEPESREQQDQDSRNNLIPTPTFNVIDTTMLPSAAG